MVYLLMCGWPDYWCTGFNVVRCLFGGSMVGLLVLLFLSFLAIPGLCCFLRVIPVATNCFILPQPSLFHQ